MGPLSTNFSSSKVQNIIRLLLKTLASNFIHVSQLLVNDLLVVTLWEFHVFVIYADGLGSNFESAKIWELALVYIMVIYSWDSFEYPWASLWRGGTKIPSSRRDSAIIANSEVELDFAG
jgi:hypothetical protein